MVCGIHTINECEELEKLHTSMLVHVSLFDVDFHMCMVFRVGYCIFHNM